MASLASPAPLCRRRERETVDASGGVALLDDASPLALDDLPLVEGVVLGTMSCLRVVDNMLNNVSVSMYSCNCMFKLDNLKKLYPGFI